jgi:hypothetical protein
VPHIKIRQNLGCPIHAVSLFSLTAWVGIRAMREPLSHPRHKKSNPMTSPPSTEAGQRNSFACRRARYLSENSDCPLRAAAPVLHDSRQSSLAAELVCSEDDFAAQAGSAGSQDESGVLPDGVAAQVASRAPVEPVEYLAGSAQGESHSVVFPVDSVECPAAPVVYLADLHFQVDWSED